LTQLADIALFQGDRDTARRRAEESASIRRQHLNSFGLGRAIETLARVAAADGDYGSARELSERAIEYWRAEAPESSNLIGSYENLGEVLRLQGDYADALDAFATSVRLARRLGGPVDADVLEGIATVWATVGQPENAARMAGAAAHIRERTGSRLRGHPSRLLPDRVEPAWSEGRAMTAEEAAEYALEKLSQATSGGGGN
jgi:tetratricopeptide (TPR) repeat protein